MGLTKPIWVAPQEKALVPVFRQNTVWKTGIFCLHENQSIHAEGEQKFSSTFSKRWWVSKGQSPLTHSAECGNLIVRRIFESSRTFCKRKSSRKPIASTNFPRKVPSGKFSAVKLHFYRADTSISYQNKVQKIVQVLPSKIIHWIIFEVTFYSQLALGTPFSYKGVPNLPKALER